MRFRAASLVLGLSAIACSSPSTNDLTVTPSISGASMTLTADTSPFCTSGTGTISCWDYSGSFEVDLALGDLASTTSDVKVQQFSLLRSADMKVLISPLAVVTTTTEDVGIGETVKDTATFKSTDQQVQMIMKPAHDDLCSGAVILSGSIYDGAQQKNIPFTSAPFTVSGC